MHDEVVEITLLHVADCPNLNLARERLADAVARTGTAATVTERLVTGPTEAAALSFAGSPTILVDGCDPFPHTGIAAGLACRVYQTPGGSAGAPTVEQLRDVLARR